VDAAAAATAPARATNHAVTAGDGAPRLAPAVRGQLLLGALRLTLALAGLLAARIAGAPGGPALLAFAVGALGFLVSIGSAERAFARGGEPEPAPPHTLEPPLRTLLAAAWPSTAGVAVFLAISVGVNAVVAALLAGVEAGMGATALLMALRIHARERALGGRVLVDRQARQTYLA